MICGLGTDTTATFAKPPAGFPHDIILPTENRFVILIFEN